MERVSDKPHTTGAGALKFTFEKYAIPYPFLDKPAMVEEDLKPALIFMPDQVLSAVEGTVRLLAVQFRQTYEKDVAEGVVASLFRDVAHCKNAIVIANPLLAWEQTLTMTRETIEQISPAMAKRFDEAIGKDWVKKKAGIPGESGGICTRIESTESNDCPGTIDFCSDGTINDPVYMTHEAGHLMAYDMNRGPPWTTRQSKTLRAVLEIQAFFLQHAFYDADTYPRRPPEMAHAITLHKRAETLSVMAELTKEFAAVDQIKAMHVDDRFKEAGYAQLEDAYSLHADEHGAAYLIGAGLWHRYKAMSAVEREKIISMLYPTAARHPNTEGIPPLEVLLELAGIRNENDLTIFMSEIGIALMSQGFTHKRLKPKY